VETEVTAALKEHILEHTTTPPDPTATFYHPLFTVPKTDGSHRLIVDMKNGNCFAEQHHFKMEGLRTLRDLIKRSDFLCKADIKAAFPHVGIHPRDRDFFRIRFKGVHYRFTALPFGYRDSPRLFTMVMRAALAPLRTKGIRIVVYLDDLLVLGQSAQQTAHHTQLVLDHLTALGFDLHRTKCHLQPTQQLEFLGFVVDTTELKLTLPEPKCKALRRAVKSAINTATAGALLSPQQLSRLIGKLIATHPAAHLAPVMLRALQHDLPRFDHRWRRASLALSDLAVRDLAWFHTNLKGWDGRSLIEPRLQWIMTTDASGTGWGAWLAPPLSDDQPFEPGCKVAEAYGFFPSDERPPFRSSNWREATATWYGLQAFESRLENTTLLVYTDNSANVAALRRGGSPDPTLSEIARRTLSWAHSRSIVLSVAHIAGVDNTLADELSRVRVDYSDFKLHPRLFEHLCQRFFRPTHDLFATAANTQLPLFFSRMPQPGAAAVDAFHQSWSQLRAYANPPFAIMGQVLRKVEQDAATIWLVAPVWKTAHWWPLLLELLTEDPQLLPHSYDTFLPGFLGSQQALECPSWRSLAASLSGAPSAREAYQSTLLERSRKQSDPPPSAITTTTGTASPPGQQTTATLFEWVQFLPWT
jgi:hypothetical protein